MGLPMDSRVQNLMNTSVNECSAPDILRLLGLVPPSLELEAVDTLRGRPAQAEVDMERWTNW